MPEVLEFEEIQTERRNLKHCKIASWLVDIPLEVAEELGLPENSQIALTVKDGEVSGDVLPPMSPDIDAIAKRILEKRREVFAELKRLGD